MASEVRCLVRSARASDAQSLAGLLAALGYPDEAPRVRARLQRLTARDDVGVLVAELAGEVVALVAYQLMDLLERSQPQCRVTTLVVDAGARRQGLASRLLGAVEAIARARGCFRLEVTTQSHREDAASFYLALGFQERPRRLVKPLPAPAAQELSE